MDGADIARGGRGRVGRWRDALQARVERRQAEHDAMVDAILTSDPEIAALEACWRMPARQPDHR